MSWPCQLSLEVARGGSGRTGAVAAGTTSPVYCRTSTAGRSGAGRGPSTWTFGSQESQPGRYQLRSPSRRMASSASAIAMPKPISWKATSWPDAKPLKTTMMIAAAPVISRAVDATPWTIASGVSLVDAAEQEHLVVHREPEQHAEQEDRDPRVDPLDLGEAEQVGADALLEDEHEDPVGGADREEVDGDRGERDRDRPECEQEQEEAQRQHERDHDRQPAPVDRERVVRLGRRPADEHAIGSGAEGGRHVVVA